MTVDEMRERISNREYNQWRAFDSYRAAMEELALKKAEAKGKVRRRGK
jgi:hypothetical protein